MKKMKFTLGLMLSMLFLGASVAYAQGHSGTIQVSASVTGCANYAGDVIVEGYWQDLADGLDPGYGSDSPFSYIFPRADIQKDTLITKTIGSWYHGGTTGSPAANNGASFVDYSWNNTTNRYLCTGMPANMNLSYLRVKNKADAYNLIYVPLWYINGNELKPLIKRTVTYGKWDLYIPDNGASPFFRNFRAISRVEVDFIVDPEIALYMPNMDRKDDIATYIYYDDVLALKSDPIYSIHYEIVMHDVIDFPDVDDPLGKLPDTYVGVQLNPDAGITTDPNHLGGAGTDRMYFVPNQNWSFTAFSETPVKVELEALYDSDKDKIIRDAETAYTVVDNKDGSYKITIKRILFNYKINIKSATLTSGDGDGDQTGNIAIANNAVWTASGNLYYQTDAPATLSIYSVTGQLVKQLPVSGSSSLALPKGLYIVQLNGKAFKVIN